MKAGSGTRLAEAGGLQLGADDLLCLDDGLLVDAAELPVELDSGHPESVGPA